MEFSAGAGRLSGRETEVVASYARLSVRELAIVAVADIDALLGEMIALRVPDDGSSLFESLGLGGMLGAPSATFGARVGHAALMGLLRRDETVALWCLESINLNFVHGS